MAESVNLMETAAFVCSHVFENSRPVLLVSRAGGDWQFLCGGGHEAQEKPHVVGLNHLVERDGSLSELVDLPPDWEAERTGIGEPWIRTSLLKKAQ
jgi:hypothetical protein